SYRIWRPTYVLAYLPVHYPVTRLPHPPKPDAIQNSTQLQLHRPAEPRPPHRRAWISRFLHDSPMNLGGESFTDLLFRPGIARGRGGGRRVWGQRDIWRYRFSFLKFCISSSCPRY
uniref:Uncharacterized protein n=1 Tax=Triticum urartu TaxID=4572 RepID=A0A8R7VCJ9_TRIUA